MNSQECVVMHDAFNLRSILKDHARLLIIICIFAYFITGFIYATNGATFNSWGDEPHFLVISQTLLKYHSLNVMADYKNGDYKSFFFRFILDPHVTTNSRHQILPLHSIGGPILWLIPFFLLGRLGAIWFIAGLSVCIIWNMYRFLLAMKISEKTAFMVSLVYALASPIYIYAHLTFIEPIGAFICIYILRKIVEKDTKIRTLIFCSICLGILPWVHIRFALLEVPLFCGILYCLYRRYQLTHIKSYLAYLLPITLLTAMLEIYNYVVWATLNPSANQFAGGSTLFEVWPEKGLFGTIFDQNHGLLICFPLCIFLLAGMVLAIQKKYRWHNLFFLALLVPYILAYTTFRHWDGGWSPPARFIMVLLPVLSFYIACALDRLKNRFVIPIIVISFCWGFTYNIISLLPTNNGFNAADKPNLTLSFLLINGHHLTSILPNVSFHHPIRYALWAILYLIISILIILLAKEAKQKEPIALETPIEVLSLSAR
jgi:hypothetical protein